MANSARRPAMRTNSSSRPGSLKLPSLPRFHPANFPSQSSSFASTPASGVNSPQPPMSPRSQQRQYSDAQRQLYVYQRELLANAGKIPSRPAPTSRPISPRLAPAGSPGPVTPLELENEGGYLMAGGHSPGTNEQAQREYVEKLIREEAARRGDISPKRTQTVGSY
ncbi:hypothetical protein NA57DRAFT_52208 [Rhizodiscina lignyota]|uniref:Uncharacterized protein n=1 Tax=Rhizodiscina lignyota TaxID=1504668 RepID=A0A9P4INC6_9PEZI|nr:hypothetical protein NA57DRAFT_52208 [Rhizodiscina lignyota]